MLYVDCIAKPSISIAGGESIGLETNEITAENPACSGYAHDTQ